MRSLDEAKAKAVADEIKAFGGAATPVGGDVASDEFIKKALEVAIKCVLIYYFPITP